MKNYAKMLLICSLIFLFSSIGLSAFSDSNYVIYSLTNSEIQIVNMSSQIVIASFDLGYDPWDITITPDGVMVIVDTSGNVRTYNNNFQLINEFVDSNVAFGSCWRENISTYFCTSRHLAGDVTNVSEYDNLGNVLTSKQMNLTIVGGIPHSYEKIFGYVNTSGSRHLLTGMSGATPSSVALIGYRMFNFDTEESIVYYNKTFSTTFNTTSYAWLDLENSRIVISDTIDDNVQTININSSLHNVSIAFTKSTPVANSNLEFWIQSKDALSYLRLNRSTAVVNVTGIREDGGSIKNLELVSIFPDVYNNMIEWNATVTQVEQGRSNVSFLAIESVVGCNLNTPVDNVTCTINGRTCTTGSPSIEQINVTDIPINANTVGGWRNGSLIFNPFKLNPGGFDLTGTLPEHSNTDIYYNSYYFYNFPTNLNEVDHNSITFSANLSADAVSDVSGTNLLFQLCELMPDNDALNVNITIYAGYNLTHYKQAHMFCIGQLANYVPETFIATADLPLLVSSFNVDSNEYNGTARVLRNEVGIKRNHSQPIIIQTGTNRVYRNDLFILQLNQSIDRTWNDFTTDGGARFTHYDEEIALSYSYNRSDPATCSVGELLNGNYSYSCTAPPGFLFSQNNGDRLTNSITIPPFSLIQVDMSRVRPLALGLTVLSEVGNPVINARCESPFSVNNTNQDGFCLLQNVPVLSVFNITVNPNNPSLPTITTLVQTGDFYNSQLRGDFGIPNSCSLFNGIFFYTINLEELGSERSLRFIVYDQDVDVTALKEAVQILKNDQAIFQEWFLRDWGILEGDFDRIRDVMATFTVAGVTVSIDGNPQQTCVTGNDGTCTISWSPDLINHNISTQKHPMYLEYSEILPLTRFNGWLVFMRRNSTWWAENPNGEQQALGTNPFAGLTNAILSPLFISIMVCIGMGIIGTVWSGGNMFIGAFSFLATFFTMLLFGFIPFWIGLVFIIIAGSLLAFFLTKGFIGSGGG